MKNITMNRKQAFILFTVFFFVLTVIFSFFLLTGRITFGSLEDGWDGETIAQSFSGGNGSEENPYIISTPEEFLYFKFVIEGDESVGYQDRYYVLANDLNFNQFEFSSIGIITSEEEKIFRGHLNGAGHTLRNIVIHKTNTAGDVSYYGLFSKTIDASVENLMIDTMTIEPEETDQKVVVGSLVGYSTSSNDEDSNAIYKNISIYNFHLDLQRTNNEENEVNAFLGNVTSSREIRTILLSGTIIPNGNKPVSIVGGDVSMSSIVDDISYSGELAGTESIENYYVIYEGVIYLNGEAVSDESVLAFFNETLGNNLYWTRENGQFFLREYAPAPVVETPTTEKSFTFSMRSAPSFALHDSGTEGQTVYINDLTADYDYYMALNYVTPNGTDTPTVENKGIYSDSNLIRFQIIYHGKLDENHEGKISYEADDNFNEMVYYKYYYASGSTIDIELIDNPFAGRPHDMAFNGWVCTDSNVTLYLDDDLYTWHAVVPVTGNTIVLELYASWVEADMARTSDHNSNINTALRTLPDVGLETVNLTETRERYVDYLNSDYNYYYRVILNQGDSRDGYYNVTGGALTGTCTNATCTVYELLHAGDSYDPDATYYYFYYGNIREYNGDPRATETYQAVRSIYENMNMGGFYVQKVLRNGESREGCRDAVGNALTGNCTGPICTVYARLPFYNDSNEENIADANTTYYYYVTRDTNIVYLNSYSNTAGNNRWTTNRPFTLTSYYNGVDSRSSAYFNIRNTYMMALTDTRVEYITVRSGEYGYTDLSSSPNGNPSDTNSADYIYGNNKNFKIGRGLRSYSNGYKIAAGVTGSNNNRVTAPRYKLIIESGNYNFIPVLSYRRSAATTSNPDVSATYGCDYDRVRNNNNNLQVSTTILGSYYTNVTCSDHSHVGVHHLLKSGTIGTTGMASGSGNYGIYLSSTYSTLVHCSMELIMEGGRIFNIYGGPGPNADMQNYNAIHIYQKGGVSDAVFGGGAYLTSNGNRIVAITGGKVNNAVAAGSNGYAGDNYNRLGILNGDTYMYVGGSAEIGDTSLADEDRLYNLETGSVFGTANGNEQYDEVGSSDNSYVVINGGTIHGNVYGGGNYGAVALSLNSGTHETKMNIVNGTIEGSVYGGGNNNGAGTTGATVNTTIDVNGGTIQGSVYGGSRAKGIIYGSSTVTINGGTISKDVYGGGEGGYTNNNSPGTYVRDNVAVTVNGGSIGQNVYGGSAYGTVNAVNRNTNTSSSTTTVTVNNGTITGSVFGGGKGGNSFTPKVVGDITVNYNGGSSGSVFGGFDDSGQPSAGDVVYLNGGTTGNAYGGGNNTGQTTTDIRLQGTNITGNLYGGSNVVGDVTTSNVTVTSGKVTEIFGGNNLGGKTTTTNVSVTGSGTTILKDIYGGGNEATSTTTNVTINSAQVNSVYGGGKKLGENTITTTNVTIDSTTGASTFGGCNVSGNVTNSHVTVTNSTFTNVYGGNDSGGETANTNVAVDSSTITNVFGGGDNATSGDSHVTVDGGTITNVFGGGNEAGLNTSDIIVTGGTITNVFGGSNKSGDITEATVNINEGSGKTATITAVYGGNNKGGTTIDTNVTATKGTISTIYGGGNEAPVGDTNVVVNGASCGDVYGGGNAATVSGNTFLDIDDSAISGSVFGGGNEGSVSGNTEVFVTNSTVLGNIYAGGNGSSAIVVGNSTVTIDGTTEVGNSSTVAPAAGCVFGSGNAASTGVAANKNSTATVNIVGGIIHGNVYGGPKMAVVYGVTETNIGTSAVNDSSLIEGDIRISGTVFGGGESNASGSTSYDWTFISVTNGIDVNINGEGYITNNHDFIINGSIFGSGNASSSDGDSNIYIKKLGSKEQPNRSISIQRATNLVIDESVIELEGTTDRTNEFSEILYSFNIIDKLVIKNGTTLLLQHNANLLQEFYSGVDSGGSVVPAVVTIDDNTKTVTKNVDNRIYMIADQKLNVATNAAATAYGRVTGMTFLGMYNDLGNGNYRYGLYDDQYSYGDTGNASLAIVGGTYVLGLRLTDHDITKDGFYSNFLDEETFTQITTAYIDPEEIGKTGYRWLIGFDAINYEFTLRATKYSSLGTYELQMIDFSKGNTKFKVLGFDGSGMVDGIDLVDVNDVPRVTDTEEEANKIFALSMKAETPEWTDYGTTKYLSEDGGDYKGTELYLTDSRETAPSLMFYLYHAKNLTLAGQIGTGVITLQASIPKNEIEDDIKFITITVHMIAINNGDEDNYDASITYDKKYEMPATTDVNITNKSQFSAYFSLFSMAEHFEDIYGVTNSYKHVLISNHALPVNTVITMMDFGANPTRPNYYYFRVTQDVYDASLVELNTYNEVTYPLEKFIRMDSTSTNNTYDDASSNLIYYDTSNQLTYEEFMFIFDFKETNVTGNHLNNRVSFELRDNDRWPIFYVLGIRDTLMYYNTYESSNVVLNQDFVDNDNYLYYNITDNFNYSTTIRYNETDNRQPVIDTNYESSSMGLNITFLDRNGDPVSSSLLVGTSFRFNGVEYFADGNGVFRIKLANKVSNIERSVGLTVNKLLPAGQYTIRYSIFASSDGLHNTSSSVVNSEFPVTVVSADNSITADCEDYTKIVYGDTGLNMNASNINTYSVKYESQLSNPNFRMEVYKRDISDVDSITYTSVPFSTLFANNYSVISGNEVSFTMASTEESIDLELNNTITSGTYRLVFKIYDSDQLIDEDIKYIIVKKKIE